MVYISLYEPYLLSYAVSLYPWDDSHSQLYTGLFKKVSLGFLQSVQHVAVNIFELFLNVAKLNLLCCTSANNFKFENRSEYIRPDKLDW